MKVIDTGIDESSCFFAHDETGDHVTHGYYFDEWGINLSLSYYAGVTNDDGEDDESELRPRPNYVTDLTSGSYDVSFKFDGGDFTAYPDRRKVSSTASSKQASK